jgi:glyoxylase-like metal-dependent hydrolase (beta-lactamase superfamily II)
MRYLIVFFVLVLIQPALLARNTVLKQITSNVVTISPDKKQLHTLGWPNDIINSVALRTDEGIVLIDTQNSPANAQLIKSAVHRRFNDSTFVYVINTHGHSCHSGGNCIFDQNNIVAHTNSIGEIKDYDDLFLGQTVEFLRKKIYHKTNVLDTIKISGAISDSINEAIDLYRFYESDLINNYKARYPDLTFEDSLTLTAGNQKIELTYMGKGHGDADIAVYLPNEAVLCTGNLFHLGAYSEENMPSFYQNRTNDIDHWIRSLDKLLVKQNKIDHILTTHGKRPLQRETLEFVNDYCKLVRKVVSEAKVTNVPIEAIKQKDQFEELFEQYRNVLSLNKKVEEMHARNIAIIWKYIE